MQRCKVTIPCHPALRLPDACQTQSLLYGYMHYAFVRVAMASPQKKACSKTQTTWMKRMRGATLGAERFPETLRRPPLGGASFSPFGDALPHCLGVFWCIEKLFSQKHTTICANFVRDFLQKWNLSRLPNNYWVCHGWLRMPLTIVPIPSVITVPWHRTLHLPRNVTLPCDFLSFPSFCFCPVLSRVPFPSWICYFSFLSLFLPLSFCYCSLWFSWFLKSPQLEPFPTELPFANHRENQKALDKKANPQHLTVFPLDLTWSHLFPLGKFFH